MLLDISHTVGHAGLRRRLRSYKLIPRPRYNCDRDRSPSKFGGPLLKDSFLAAAVESATDCDKIQVRCRSGPSVTLTVAQEAECLKIRTR